MSHHDAHPQAETEDHGHPAPDLDALDPEEPHSPAWLPLLGLGLALLVVLWAAVGARSAGGEPGAPRGEAAAEIAAPGAPELAPAVEP